MIFLFGIKILKKATVFKLQLNLSEFSFKNIFPLQNILTVIKLKI